MDHLDFFRCELFSRARCDQNIGVFQEFFGYLNVAGVLTNVGIAIYVTPDFNTDNGWSSHQRDMLFICLCCFFFAIVVCIRLFVQDIPLDVHLQMARQQFINEKIIEKIADEDNIETLDKDAAVDYVVHDADDGPYYRDISFYREDDHISIFQKTFLDVEKDLHNAAVEEKKIKAKLHEAELKVKAEEERVKAKLHSEKAALQKKEAQLKSETN